MPKHITPNDEFEPGTIRVRTLKNKFNAGKLFLRPTLQDYVNTFQRLPWWKRAKKMYLIYSIIDSADTNSPPMYFSEDIDGNLKTMDGQQRICTIMEYINNDFKLTISGMKSMGGAIDQLGADLHNKFYKDLEEDQQEKLLDHVIRTEILNEDDFKGSAGKSKMNKIIRKQFYRLNKTGGMTDMEIRKVEYMGHAMALIFELQEELGFVSLDENDTSVKKNNYNDYFFFKNGVFSLNAITRMDDTKLILQALAITRNEGPQNRNQGMDEFCLDYMKKMSPEVKDDLKDKFLKNIKIIDKISETGHFNLSASEFKNKHDFYSLYAAVDELRRNGLISTKTNFDVAAQNLTIFSKAVSGLIHKNKTGSKSKMVILNARNTERVEKYVYSRTENWNVLGPREIRTKHLVSIMNRNGILS